MKRLEFSLNVGSNKKLNEKLALKSASLKAILNDNANNQYNF